MGEFIAIFQGGGGVNPRTTIFLQFKGFSYTTRTYFAAGKPWH